MLVLKIIYLLFLVLVNQSKSVNNPFIIISGIAQDAGYPQADCNKDCCKKYWGKKTSRQKVSSLALFDPETKQKWLFDATPDFTEQLYEMNKFPG